MCGIAGIRSKNGKNLIVKRLYEMLEEIQHRGPDGAGITINNDILYGRTVGDIESTSSNVDAAIGHVRLAIVGGTCGSQPFQSCDKKFTVEHNGEIYNYKELKSKLLEKNHKFITDTDSEVIVHLLEENYKRSDNIIGAIKKTIQELDGYYAIVIKDKTGKVYLVRDKIGVRQLYYGENKKFLAFASEKKALWKLDINDNIRTLSPGHYVVLTSKGFSDELPYWENNLDKLPVKYEQMEDAVEAYYDVLLQSMRKRTQDLQRVGIVFSGGIDSVIIAALAKKLVPEVICYTSGFKNSSDVLFARKVAEQLGLTLKINELTDSDVEKMLPQLSNIIETNNLLQLEVAIPIYASISLASKDKIRVMFSGQGADELFAGYPWYSKIVDSAGYKKLREYMTKDLFLLYKESLEREDKISMSNAIELRVPYLDVDVIETAMQIDLKLNLIDGKDDMGKRVHRELAKQKLHIPDNISYRSKEAAQHGSGMHDVIRRLAIAHGYTEDNITSEYIEQLKKREKLGSSQRYGYLYGDALNWNDEPNVQKYVDAIAIKRKK